MMSKTFITVASFLAAASALTITKPTLNDTWDFSQSNTIEWTSVSTDPSTFEIVLVDHSTQPETTEALVDSVNTADGKYTFSNFVTTPSKQYQVNFLGNTNQNSGIIAQSQSFTVSKSGVNATKTASTSTSSATATDASASSSSTGNAAAQLGVPFGVAGPILAALCMLF